MTIPSFWAAQQCATEVWIKIEVGSQHIDQFGMSEMLEAFDQQCLPLRAQKAHLLGQVDFGSGLSLKDKLATMNEQIMELIVVAQWVKLRQEKINDFLVPQIQRQREIAERIPERMVGPIVHVFVPHVTKKIVDVRAEHRE